MKKADVIGWVFNCVSQEIGWIPPLYPLHHSCPCNVTWMWSSWWESVLRWALTNDSYLWKKRDIWTKTRGRRRCSGEGNVGRTVKAWLQVKTKREKAQKSSPPRDSGVRVALLTPSFLASSLQNCDGIHCFNPTDDTLYLVALASRN